MNLCLVKLGSSTTILGIGFALVEALPVTVVEGDVAYAGPAVLDYGCGMEFGHGFMVLVLLYKGTKNQCKLSLVFTSMPGYSICTGAMVGLKAYVVHAIQVCGGFMCVRLLSEGAMSGLWRWFVRFGYMAHSPTDAHKYGNCGGSGGLL